MPKTSTRRERVNADPSHIEPWRACVESESRTCFGIWWFATEAEADQVAKQVRASGAAYNGGWYHGRPCGRDPSFDDYHGRKLYAVTH